MLKIDRTTKRFERLPEPDLKEIGESERYGLQAMIRRNPAAFFDELGETLLLIGEEVRPTDVVEDRIDLLGLDPSGAVVIVELKRGSHKLQLLQALAYAGMIAQWTADQITASRGTLTGSPAETVEDEIHQFLLEDAERINETQRIILVAEEYDYEVLVAAEWLHEKFGVDVRCYRLALSTDGTSEYMSCMCVYPPKELADHASRRGRGPTLPVKWADWEAALVQIVNPVVVTFFKKELAAGRDSYLRKRILRYKIDGRRRWWLSARKDFAYTWQDGRFPGDDDFWREKLGDAADVRPVKRGTCLRFVLSTQAQFDSFLTAILSEVKNSDFVIATAEGSDEEEV